MPELRYDILSGTYTIVASERAKRPNDFRSAQEGEGVAPKLDPKCPFCPGNENMTPPEISALRDEGAHDGPNWRIRVVPNKFPALLPVRDALEIGIDLTPADNPIVDDSSIYWETPAVGAHEVVIESPKHNGTLGGYSSEEMAVIFNMLNERYLVLYDQKAIKYVQVFRNWGPLGGASLAHPHFQIIGLPFMPPEVLNETSRYREYRGKTGRCIMCDYVEREIEKDLRVVAKSREFVILCPFASKYSFETLIVPRRHSTTFSELNAEEARDMAQEIIGLFYGYEEMFLSLSYNLVVHSLPPQKRSKKQTDYHWHMHVYPRLNVEAGLEKGAGVWINPTPPELAALQFPKKG